MKKFFLVLLSWIFDESVPLDSRPEKKDKVDWLQCLPFIVLHLSCLLVFWVGWNWVAVVCGILFFLLRMFGLTAGYHRYFSHRSFETSRVFQFVLTVLGNASAQRGALWWAAHHRHHHLFADRPEDEHSPLQHGFWTSHILWFMKPRNFATEKKRVKCWLKFPELVFLNRFPALVPLLMVILLYIFGESLRRAVPDFETSGLQMVVWGFCIPTIILFNLTATINSLDHMFGQQRYATGDQSRNNWILAILTMGEGWHNNHHHYPIAARNGFFWWEIDMTYYILRFLEQFHVVWNLNKVPPHRLNQKRVKSQSA
jgi:stearoyl-CoA desaturase (delta-9 desaturase)